MVDLKEINLFAIKLGAYIDDQSFKFNIGSLLKNTVSTQTRM